MAALGLQHGYTKPAYLDMCVQLLPRYFKRIIEGELKKIVEDGGGHVVQMDEALWSLSHSGLGQGSEVLAALGEPPEVHLKN